MRGCSCSCNHERSHRRLILSFYHADIAKAGEIVQQLTGVPEWAADAAFAALFGGLCFSGEEGVGSWAGTWRFHPAGALPSFITHVSVFAPVQLVPRLWIQ